MESKSLAESGLRGQGSLNVHSTKLTPTLSFSPFSNLVNFDLDLGLQPALFANTLAVSFSIRFIKAVGAQVHKAHLARGCESRQSKAHHRCFGPRNKIPVAAKGSPYPSYCAWLLPEQRGVTRVEPEPISMAPTLAIALLSCTAVLSAVLATAPSKVRIAGRGHSGRRTGVAPVAQPAGPRVVPPMNGTGNFSLVWSTNFFDQWYTAASLTSSAAAPTSSSLPFMLTGGNW